jgi:hypothetical protein
MTTSCEGGLMMRLTTNMPTMANINIATPTRIAMVFFIYPNPFPISKRDETLYAYD